MVLLEPRLAIWKSRLPRLKSFASRELSPGLIENGEIKNMDGLRLELRDLLDSARVQKIYGIGVVANLPEAKTFLKYVPAPELNGEEEIKKIVQKTISTEIPFAKEELITDTQLFQNSGGRSLLIGAAPKSSADAYIALLEGLGLTIYALEIEAVAIARAIGNGSQLGELPKTEMIIDIGAERTSVIFTTGGVPRLTVLVPFSGNQLTKLIADRLKITYEQAEQTKLNCGLDLKLCEGGLRTLLGTVIEDFILRLKNAVKYYHSQFKDAPKVTSIRLSGGGSYLLKLDSVISQELRVKARKADISSRLAALPKTKTDDFLHYTTAFGLALRGSNYVFEDNAV